MSKKILWPAVSGLMALALILSACAQVATPPTPTTPSTLSTPSIPSAPSAPTIPVEKEPVAVKTDTVTVTLTKLDGTKMKKTVEKPQYGGMLTRVFSAEPRGFDDLTTFLHQATGQNPVMSALWRGAWERGPAGTGEFDDISGGSFLVKEGLLFEKWELFETGRGVYHIRPGIKYGLNPLWEASRLVNGREFTALDAEYALNRLAKTPGSYQYNAAPEASRDVKIKALDKYTLEIDIYPEQSQTTHYFFGTFAFADTPKEVIQKYGSMKDWRNIVGSGPFMLTDYVPASLLTYVRNPNYFLKDPVTGNQMPYVDGMKILIVPDASTRLAALRTGKIDELSLVELQDAKSLLKTSPQLENKFSYGAVNAIFMRTDKPELPYKDIRVRQALTLATDFNAINQAAYDGLGVVPGYPLAYTEPLKDYFLTLNEAPKAVQDLFTYNPEKAKQLMKEAGYPNGFKAEIIVSSAGGNVDELAIFKSMWAKVGVELVFQLRDSGVYTTIANARSHADMIYAGIGGTSQLWPRGFGNLYAGVQFNLSYINEPYVKEAIEKYNAAWLRGDEKERMRTSKDLMARVYYDSWAIGRPTSVIYSFWWPWIKNYYAANAGGFQGFPHQYLWVDQELKKSMGH